MNRGKSGTNERPRGEKKPGGKKRGKRRGKEKKEGATKRLKRMWSTSHGTKKIKEKKCQCT